jgi:hypothetical protein
MVTTDGGHKLEGLETFTSDCNADPATARHLTRYHGVVAPNHHLRAAIVPAGATATTAPPRPASRRRLDWASLLKRVFATDVLACHTCGGVMHILPEGDASPRRLTAPTPPPPSVMAIESTPDLVDLSSAKHRTQLGPRKPEPIEVARSKDRRDDRRLIRMVAAALHRE